MIIKGSSTKATIATINQYMFFKKDFFHPKKCSHSHFFFFLEASFANFVIVEKESEKLNKNKYAVSS
jgi:hypothetical protein